MLKRRDFVSLGALALAGSVPPAAAARPVAHWTRTERGVFECDADYWAKSGGILAPMPRYEAMYGNFNA